jgi:hypothetical protein
MILEIVAIVLLFLILLIAAILLIPFRVILDASFSLESTRTNILLSWLGLTLWQTKERFAKPKKPEEKKTEKKKTDPGGIFRMFSLFRESIPAFVIIGKSAKRAVFIRRIDLQCTFGSGDPAETAVLAGFLWGFAWGLNRIPRVSVAFRPAFETQELNGTLDTDVKVRALPVAIGFLRAYTKKPFRQFIRQARNRQ